MPKILIIGNGFDLAHDLLTKYEDFLDFCILFDHMLKYTGHSKYDAAIKNLDSEKKAVCSDAKINDSVAYAIKHIFSTQSVLIESDYSKIGNAFKQMISVDGKSIVVKSVFEELITNNVWIDYFISLRGKMGGNWIDFETEISEVLDNIDEIEKLAAADIHKSKYKIIKRAYSKALEKDITTTFIEDKGESFKFNFIDKLYCALNNLIRALEIYFTAFVENIEVKIKQPIISAEKFDLVLSFNYTDTFRRVYQSDMDDKHICFIHGRAKLENTIESCNLVLGVQETIKADNAEEELELLVFKKYYQRIYKGTDSQYLDWLSNLERFKNQSYEIYIFGHSLDVTDHEVLRAFIDVYAAHRTATART